jgi:transposase
MLVGKIGKWLDRLGWESGDLGGRGKGAALGGRQDLRPRTGPKDVLQASLFVAVLGASSYTYAEATEDETMSNWIGAHVRAFEFMGGVAELLIPDNTKTGVSKACRYEPDLNPTYQEMAMHYGLGVLPTRRRARSVPDECCFVLRDPNQ